jgi:calmodulin
VLVTEEDIDIAFKLLASGGDGSGGSSSSRVGVKQLAERLRCFRPALEEEEAAFTMGDEKFLTTRYLKDLLLDNTITHFDPIAEAWRCYDPEGTGRADRAALVGIFGRLGMPMTDEDVGILMSLCGAGGGEGAAATMTVQDFQRLMGKTGERAPTNAELGRTERDE